VIADATTPADHSAFVRELTALCRAYGVTLDLRAGDGCPPEVASAVRDADVEIVLRPIDPSDLGEWTETNSGAVYWPIRERLFSLRTTKGIPP
jgi:hypothetical protein